MTKDEITEAYGRSLKGAWKVLDGQLASSLGAGWNFRGLCFSIAQALVSTVVHEEGWPAFISTYEQDVISSQVASLMALLDDNKDGKISRQEWLCHCAELPIFK